MQPTAISNFAAAVFFVACLVFVTSCSDQDDADTLAVIQKSIAEGDKQIAVMTNPNVALRREWETVHRGYVKLRELYCGVADRLAKTDLNDNDLASVLEKLKTWEGVIDRFRLIDNRLRSSSFENQSAEFVDPSKTITPEEIKQRRDELGLSKQDEERAREWTASEQRLDNAVSAIGKMRHSRN